MIFHIEGSVGVTGLKRAFDQLLLFLVEQDAAEMRGVFISAEIWRGCERLQCIDAMGQQRPAEILQYPDGAAWDISGSAAPQYIPADQDYAPTALTAVTNDGVPFHRSKDDGPPRSLVGNRKGKG